MAVETEQRVLAERLWGACNQMRGKMDAAQCRVLIIPLIWLKYISESFEHQRKNSKDQGHKDGDFDQGGRFWVPKNARWDYLINNDNDIDYVVSTAYHSLAEGKPLPVKNAYNVFARGYANLDPVSKEILLKVILLFNKKTEDGGLPNFFHQDDAKALDLLGNIYEFFLGKFAQLEKRGGEFYTPRTVVSLIVKMLQPFDGDIYDGCCGTGGMFTQDEDLKNNLINHKSKVYGQESNAFTWSCAIIKFEHMKINYDLGEHNQDTLLKPIHRGQKWRYGITNPPFNLSKWGADVVVSDQRWIGIDAVESDSNMTLVTDSNANFAWIQHYLHHLTDTGMAGIVMSNGCLSTNKKGEKNIREAIVIADKLDCVVRLPDNLFTNTPIPACILILANSKNDSKSRNREGETLFLDCRRMGEMINRKLRVLTEEEIVKISETYRNWQSKEGFENYQDEAGFCKAVSSINEIIKNEYVITPGRYVGAPIIFEDEGVFEEKMNTFVSELGQQIDQLDDLTDKIKKNLEELGFDF